VSEYAIIPRPVSVEYLPGNFQCSGIPRIADGVDAAVFTEQIRATFGDEAFARDTGVIRLLKKEGPAAEEFYRMEIRPDEICVSAATETGIYRGLKTLRQLFLSGYDNGCSEGRGTLSIPCGIIEDQPRFSWRGFMLDCSRNFYSVGFIKHLLDALSLQHINIFHWHLTDDQGWRLPVRQYPLLTAIGSRRQDHRFRGKYIGGFYTEAEIRDIVSFAAARHIEVTPEVDLPGHTSSVLAAYPGLGCTGGPYRVEDRFSIFEDVLCAGNDGIFPLVEAVFDTLAELFPSRYVHIGGDEVRFNRWAECPKCQKRMDELGLEKPAQLQSWLTARFAQMLKQRGKTAIGWDEVLEHTEQFPLPEDLIVMSWRGQKGGSRATALGHRVIMTPHDNGCYLDYKNFDDPEEPGQLNVNTIEQGYNMEAVTPDMDGAAASLVLGGQGNLWSEIIYAGKIAEYMIFPRICAIAETLWSDRKSKDIEDFYRRLAIHQCRLDKLGLLQCRK
jgi:hexosaminidase